MTRKPKNRRRSKSAKATNRRRPRRGRTSRAPRPRGNDKRVHRSARAKKQGRVRRIIAAVALVLVGVASGAFLTALGGLWWFRDRSGPAGEGPVAVSWPEGLEPSEAAELLVDLGLTDNRAAMVLFLRATDTLECARPGPHLLPSGATPRKLAAALCRSDRRDEVKVTIPEGFHRFAIAKRLASRGVVAEDAFLHASADTNRLYRLGVEPSAHPRADTAEGFLFPATYDFPIDSDPQEVVARLVREGVARLARMKQRHADGFETLRDELGFDDRAVITLASMVEKEAAVAEERALIASVFLNRLRRDDYPHLQSDPTAVYGCYAMPDEIPACKGFTGKATPAINRDRTNVFSTYVTPGLPPGPVGNPGEASIESVLNPADTSYLFFVAKGKGRHEFTEDYESHTRAVERLRAMRP